MAKPPPNGGQKDLHHAVKLREERNERWQRDGERSIWQNLSMIGALGWLIVTPILIGVFAGRWLDRTFETGIFYSGALIFVGALLGAYLAWHRIQSK